MRSQIRSHSLYRTFDADAFEVVGADPNEPLPHSRLTNLGDVRDCGQVRGEAGDCGEVGRWGGARGEVHVVCKEWVGDLLGGRRDRGGQGGWMSTGGCGAPGGRLSI